MDAPAIESGRVTAAVEAAVDWLLRSGIQCRADGSPARGGVHSYYRTDAGQYAYVYAEITGYALTLLAHLHTLRPDDRVEIERAAEDAWTWLQRRAWAPEAGGYRCRYQWEAGEFHPYRVCTFDNAMCLTGVAAWARIRGDLALWAEASRLAGFLGRMQNADGTYNVRTLGRRPKVENTYATWSTQIGCFLAKGVIGLLSLRAQTGDPRLEEQARRACDAALRFQDPSGRFVTHLLERHTLQHPHLYTVEALLVAGVTLGERRYLEAAFRGVDWSLQTQLPDGGLPSMVYGDGGRNEHQRMDVQAQAVRAACLASAHGHPLDQERVARGVARLLAAQSSAEPRPLRGGFLYGADHDGTPLPHANSWVTMFGIQALLAYERAVAGEAQADLFLLV